MSLAFITFGLLTAALKLFAESMELFVKTKDVLNRPKSSKRLLEAKTILNVLAAISAVVALVAPFFGPSDVVWAIIVTIGVLLALTATVAVLVWREEPVNALNGPGAPYNDAEGNLPT